MILEKVLIADDTPLVRQMLGSYVKALGYTDVLIASDGKIAVNLYKSRDIDITFLDITFLDIDMPKLNGIEALKQIKEHNKDAYVVIVSGESTLENIELSIASGANGFITKPFNSQKIIEVIKNYEKQNTKTQHKQKARQAVFSEKVEQRAAQKPTVSKEKAKNDV